MKHSLSKEAGPLVALLVLIAVFALCTAQFFTLENGVAIVESSAIPTILAVGMSFVILQGSIDLSIEGIMATTAMVTSLLIANSTNGNNLGWLALAAALACGLAFGLANGMIYTLFRLPSLIATLASWFIGLGIATLLFPGRQPQILDPLLGAMATGKHAGLSVIAYAAMLAVLAGWLAQSYTHFGRLSLAIGLDERAARQAGQAVTRHKIAAFALMGLLAGVAGVLLTAQLSVGSPVAGQGLLFPTISAAVIGGTLLSGGTGGVVQSVVGVLILEVLRNGLVQLGVNTYLQHIIEGATIIAALTLGNWHLRTRIRVVK